MILKNTVTKFQYRRDNKSMCGIFEAVGNIKEGKQVIANMIKVIEHRGADGEDCYIPKETAYRKKLGFSILIWN